MSTPALPTFQMLQQQAVPTQPNIPSAPSGGANSPPVPVSQPGGMGLPTPPPQAPQYAPPAAPSRDPYLVQLEQAGRLPAGRFNSVQEAFEAVYDVAQQTTDELDRFKAQPPAAPAPQQMPVAPAEDLNKMAMAFQQNGWMALENGQWVAKQAAAGQLAQQLNHQILEAQARQAELSDPTAFIAKYGKAAIEQYLSPVQKEIENLRQQNLYLHNEISKNTPKPHEAWVKQNESVLWTTDQSGARTPSVVGKAYGDAWDMAASYGMSAEDVHKFATTAVTPYLATMNQQAPVATPAPQQPWMQQVLQSPPAQNPAFNAPGTYLNNSVPHQQRDVSLDNDGLPSFARLQALPQ